MPLESITIFTDGSSRGNPGPGGLGAVIVYSDSELKVESGKWKVKEIGGREEHTTNNRMELQAAIEALQALSRFNLFPDSRLNLYSDSSYLINGITKWIFGWQKNGWKTKEKKDVENKDLWEQLLRCSTIYRTIEWRLVEGHAGVAGNVRCDEIATAFADNLSPKLYAGILENYSIKSILDISQGRTLGSEKGSTLKKQRSRAHAYSYVSLVDGVVQTHKTWAECERRVKGKKAKYKKVLSAEEESELVAEWSTP